MRLARHHLSRAHDVTVNAMTSTGTESTASGARPAMRNPVSMTETAATHPVAGRNGSMRRPHPVPMIAA
jgi:hypothetical protein